MQMSPYLIFNGNCAEAFPFYERVLGGRIVLMHFGRGTRTEPGDPAWPGNVVHAQLDVGACSLLGSDGPPGEECGAGRNVLVAISVPAAEAESVFRALADGGRITMPFEETFWTPGFGMLVDRFGTPWMVSTDPSS